jgi:hypothetical protein
MELERIIVAPTRSRNELMTFLAVEVELTLIEDPIPSTVTTAGGAEIVTTMGAEAKLIERRRRSC